MLRVGIFATPKAGQLGGYPCGRSLLNVAATQGLGPIAHIRPSGIVAEPEFLPPFWGSVAEAEF
ncbi:MAG TPA: hypothetical protein VGK54_04185, partial [Chloroflexota bacterium]